jgi:hypothetical protein
MYTLYSDLSNFTVKVICLLCIYCSLLDTNIHFRVKSTKTDFTTFEKYSKPAYHEETIVFFSVKKKEKIPWCIPYRESADVGRSA